jgi:hypothetical protein
MVVTAKWCTTNVPNLFWISIGASNAPFTLLPLTPLQVRNQPRAPTTQTRHPGHALVQWGSCGDHLVAGVNTWLYLPNLRARMVCTILNFAGVWPERFIGVDSWPHTLKDAAKPEFHVPTFMIVW